MTLFYCGCNPGIYIDITFIRHLCIYRIFKVYMFLEITCYVLFWKSSGLNLLLYCNAYVKNNAWVNVNNDFSVTREAICQWFSRTTKSRMKINGKSRHSRVSQKSLFTVTNVLFYFLHATLCPEHTIALKTIIHRSLRYCCYGRSFLIEHCNVTTVDRCQSRQNRHANVGSGIVTLYSSIVLARANWRKGNLY